jgi:hypothetical protein
MKCPLPHTNRTVWLQFCCPRWIWHCQVISCWWKFDGAWMKVDALLLKGLYSLLFNSSGNYSNLKFLSSEICIPRQKNPIIRIAGRLPRSSTVKEREPLYRLKKRTPVSRKLSGTRSLPVCFSNSSNSSVASKLICVQPWFISINWLLFVSVKTMVTLKPPSLDLVVGFELVS